MKAANAAIRKHRKAGPAEQIEALVVLGFGESAATALIEPDCCGRIGFPDYALQNNNANIRRLKARIPRVEAIQNADERSAEHTSELQSRIRIQNAVLRLKKQNIIRYSIK